MIVNMRDAAYTKFKIKNDQKLLMAILLNSGLRDLLTMEDNDEEQKAAIILGQKIVSDLGYAPYK